MALLAIQSFADLQVRSYRWLTLLLLLFAGAVSSSAQATTPQEYQIKAVFLFNFTQFVDWPPTAFVDPRTPLVIGVLGEDPFGLSLIHI